MHPATRSLALAVLFAVALPAAAADLDAVRALAVQDGGRIKPLDTFGRETARRVSGAKPFTGGESVAGMDPALWILSMLAEPGRWRNEAIVRVAHADLRAAVGLPANRDRFSFAELVDQGSFVAKAEAVRARQREDREAQLTPVENELSELYDTLSLMAGVFSGEALRIVPRANDPRAAWFSSAELGALKDPALAPLKESLAGMIVAVREGRPLEANARAASLTTQVEALAPAARIDAGRLATEIRYNHLKPFRFAWILYLVGFLLLLSSFPLGARALSVSGAAAIVAGFAIHSYGMVLRTLVSGRAPVTNMYESVVFVAWGAILFALIFEAVYRVRLFAACASGLAVLALILADNVPLLDGSITPLVPVLRDNFWLTTHVLTITLGYAAFFLAMGIGHLNLGLFFFAPRRAALLKSLSLFLYRALQVGTFFLAAGTLLGGIWASYSWGRFWGWDPKETWALIALLGYLAILHGRFMGLFKDFGMAVGSILGFQLVLMAWYGVNYILGTGLHSYGFGAGGTRYVVAFVAFETAVIVAALLRRRSGALPAGVPARQPAAAHS